MMKPGDAAAAEAGRARGGVARAREALGEACGACPERDGALRREFLCRCPVALGLRLLVRVERHGPSPATLSPAERASLDYQERSLARRLPPFEPAAIERCSAVLAASTHENCPGAGCLQCRAARVAEALSELLLQTPAPR